MKTRYFDACTITAYLDSDMSAFRQHERFPGNSSTRAQLLARFSLWRARREEASIRAEKPDDGIGAEAPIRTASEDRLRRADFADRIATVLSELSPREGRVFAIRGEWGFGKSSLKNLIAERLDARDDGAAWLDFNPWQWGDGDTITRALFGQMADRLGGKHSQKELDRAQALRRYGAILTGASAPIKEYAHSNDKISTLLTNVSLLGVASAIGFKLPTVAKVAAALAGIAVGASVLGRLLSYLGRDQSQEPLDKVRKDLEALLRELGHPLVVFVDDIDRLEPKQIRLLLRQVKANANLPNIVFVLLFQPNIVERALARVADGDGRAFLEKIVQASFDLPAVPVSTVHQLFAEELSELVGGYATEANGFSETRWGNAFVGCIKPMLRNLRDARRLMSSIAVHLPLHVVGDVFEVNIVDFLLLETLRVFEPNLHQALSRERELVLQEWRSSGRDQKDLDQAAAARLLTLASEERLNIARDVLKDLFPPLEWAYGGMEYGNDFQLGWLAAKRVCTKRYFPRYFELQTAPGEMSESRFTTFLDATATEVGMANAIADVEADDLLSSLVARLADSIDKLPIENAAVLLSGIFVIAEKFASQPDGNMFNPSWVSAWRTANRFLKRIPKNVRGDMAFGALLRSEALSVAATLIELSDPSARRAREIAAFDPALEVDTVEAMKREWLRLMRSRAADVDTLIAEPNLVSLLYRWKNFAGSLDEPKNWVTEAIRSDKGFATMATRMMSRVTSHTSGDHVSVSHNKFDRGTIIDFIGTDVAAARCNAIDPAEFPEHAEALRTLQSFIERWRAQDAIQTDLDAGEPR